MTRMSFRTRSPHDMILDKFIMVAKTEVGPTELPCCQLLVSPALTLEEFLTHTQPRIVWVTAVPSGQFFLGKCFKQTLYLQFQVKMAPDLQTKHFLGYFFVTFGLQLCLSHQTMKFPKLSLEHILFCSYSLAICLTSGWLSIILHGVNKWVDRSQVI